MNKFFLLVILFLLFFNFWSQNNSISVVNHLQIHKCGKHTRPLSQDLVKLINEETKSLKAQTYTVSIVFHDYANTSDIAISQMVDQLNSNFSLAVAGGGGDETDIRFCIAKIDPNGNPTTGIIHSTGTSTNNFFGYSVTQTPSNIAIWSPEEYLNVYIVNSIPGSANGVASLPWNYATNPNQPALSNPNAPYNAQLTATLLTTNPAFAPLGNKDGIIIESGTINTSQNYVMTHEAGHYLGLPHPFSSSSPSSCVDGDGLSCTGNSIQIVPNNCTPPGTCSGMDEKNFMVYGACTPYRYRVCQKDVMRYVLNNQRNGLVNSGRCDKAYDLNVNSAVITKNNCDLTFSSNVTIKNEGAITLTQAKLRYQINGGAFVNYNWTGNLSSGNSTTINLTGLVGVNGANTFLIEVRTPNTALNNNKSDQEIGNDAKSKSFTMNQPSPVSVSSSNSSICSGESINLSASGSSSYSWNQGLGNGANKSDSPTTTTNYIVTGTTSGCVTTDNIQVVVNQNPISSVSNLVHETCQNQNASFILAASGAQSPYEYSVNNGTYSNVSNFTSLDEGVYVIKVKDANGCESSANNITITNTGGFISSLTPDSSVCIGQSVPLSVSSSSTGLSYAWSNSLPASQSNTVGPASTTTYSVDVSDPDGCLRTHTSTITIVDYPIINTSLSNVVLCRDESVSVQASGADTYSWNTGDIGMQGTLVYPSNLSSVVVTGVNQGICSSTHSIPVVQSNMSTSITQDATICSGEVIQIQVSSSQAPSGGVTRLWDNGLSNSAAHNVSPNLTTTYEVVVTDSYGCDDTLMTTISVIDRPVLVLSTDSVSLCPGDSILINASGASEYIWSNGNITSSVQLQYPVNLDSVTVSGVNGGICFDVDVINIYESFMQNNITSSTTICSEDSLEINVNSTGNQLSYDWNQGLNNSQSHYVAPLDTTEYEVVVEDYIGCKDTLSMIVNVLTSPDIVLSHSDIILCQEDSVVVSANGADDYSWNTGDTTSSIVVSYPTGLDSLQVFGINGGSCIRKMQIPIFQSELSGVINEDQSICEGGAVNLLVVSSSSNVDYNWSNGLSNVNFHSVSPLVTTVYSVELVDEYGCVDSLSTSVTVDNIPDLEVTPLSASVCEGDSVEFLAIGANAYSWSTGDSINSIVFEANGTTNIQVTGHNGVCSQSHTVPVFVTSAPVIVASSNATSINTGGAIQFYSTGSSASSLEWNFGDGSTTSLGNPYHTFAFSGAYNVVLTGSQGMCESTDTILVYVGTVGINSNDEIELIVYPNPSSGVISFSNEVSNLNVFNSIGQVLYSDNESTIDHVDLSFLPAGIYNLKLELKDSIKVIQVQIIK